MVDSLRAHEGVGKPNRANHSLEYVLFFMNVYNISHIILAFRMIPQQVIRFVQPLTLETAITQS